MTTSESKGRFFYKTNRFESIRITNRIANWNALLVIISLHAYRLFIAFVEDFAAW